MQIKLQLNQNIIEWNDNIITDIVWSKINEILKNKNNIETRIKKGEDLFKRDIQYKVIEVDETFPEYIFKNKEYFKDWII